LPSRDEQAYCTRHDGLDRRLLDQPERGVKAALAVLGTASDVGKSVITTGLCRLLSDEGLDVVPFKAQNMANQAGVTRDGLEMPRAQILQAHAARHEPHVDMGPILLKPVSQTGAQLIVLGKVEGQVEAAQYFDDTSALASVALEALRRLADRHDVIVLEGAGSPVEINLWPRDFVNLRAARAVDAGIVLVADIERGGVFAQVKGTLDLLPPEDRERVVGIIVNRFRGDPFLFESGVAMLEKLAGVPVLAVVPYLDHGLDEEDRPLSIPLNQPAPEGMLRVGVVLGPSVSNTDDLAPLLSEPDVHLTWLTDPRLVAEQDLVILPASKATVADLVHHTTSGMAEAVRDAHHSGTWILGLCGGYQMLGLRLDDRAGTEGGPGAWPGLGLLPISTVFEPEKRTRQSRAVSAWPVADAALSGYEIRHGRSHATTDEGEPLVHGAGAEIGWRHGRVLGCYLHGLLASDPWRAAFLNRVREDRGHRAQPVRVIDPLDVRIDRWAQHLRRSFRPEGWERLLRRMVS
jgi:adenosylcobyric acid synthase